MLAKLICKKKFFGNTSLEVAKIMKVVAIKIKIEKKRTA
jgi:hypothetical protein